MYDEDVEWITVLRLGLELLFPSRVFVGASTGPAPPGDAGTFAVENYVGPMRALMLS